MDEDNPQALINDYLAECQEHLAAIEADLLAIEASRTAVDEGVVNRVFRAVHSIKGGASLLGFTTIRQLAHQVETALDWIRIGSLAPTGEVISVLLRSGDALRELVCNCRDSDRADIPGVMAELAGLAARRPAQQAV